jgi:hypothetical protein
MVASVEVEVAALYTIVVVSLALSVLAVFFAYRLSRTTGLFGAWTLLIAGLALTAFEDFAYFGSVVFVSYSKVEVLVEGYTAGSWLFAGLILIAIPALFFASMFRLHSIFTAQKAEAAEAQPVPA